MKTIAIIDTETGGLDPAVHPLLEVGCVLWSVEYRALVGARSWLKGEGPLENAALAVNGIDPMLARNWGLSAEEFACEVVAFAGQADALTAWNADFDRRWLPDMGRPWFCAMDDLSWPRASSSRKLAEVALAHGVGVVDAHRALTDCLTIARLLERVAEMHDADRHKVIAPGYAFTFEDWLARALRPKVHVEVADKGFDADRNALAKEHGFRWEAAPVKAWRRKMFAEDADKLPFRVVEVR